MNRHRERELANESEHVITYITCENYDNNGNLTSTYNTTRDRGNFQVLFEHESIDDVVTPEYKKLSAQGHIINNPLSQTKLLRTVSLGQSHLEWINSVSNGTSKLIYNGLFHDLMLLGDIISPPSINVDTLVSKAVTKAYASMDTSKASILNTVAEIDKTIASIVQIFWRAYRIFRSIRKLDVKALKKEITPKELSDRYMEARYAIRPLVIDVQQIFSAVAHKRTKDRQTFRGFETDSDSASRVVHKITREFDYSFQEVASVHVEARAGVLTDISCVNSLDTWGMNHVLEACWEIVPFSFIIDWFTNIGDIIRSWTPEPNVRTLSSWVVVKTTTTKSRTFLSGIMNTSSSGLLSASCSASGSIYETTQTKVRSINPVKPWIPSFDVNLDPFKIADLGIILNQFRKR